MIKGSTSRKIDNGVNPLFVDRWSPRAMSGESISVTTLASMLEAARWAPSSNNNQPWRIVYSLRGSNIWDAFLDLLVEGNREWCRNAGALVVFLSKTTFDHSGKDSVTHSFDAGAAWMSFALQGWINGLVVHGMQGFDYERARTVVNAPEGYQVEAMAAVGMPGSLESLSEKQQNRETPSTRKPLDQIAFEGTFPTS